MSDFTSNIKPATFAQSSIIIGYFLSNQLDPFDQNSIGNWLILVGQIMKTFSGQTFNVVAKKLQNSEKCPTDQEQFNCLEDVLTKIQEELAKLKK